MTETNTVVRPSAHAECDHPKTKTARAACRRNRNSIWSPILRENAAKGDNIRVHTGGLGAVEGQMLGWGEKRIIVRLEDDSRKVISIDDVVRVETRA